MSVIMQPNPGAESSSSSSSSIVEVKNIGMIYPGGTVALEGLDLEFPTGKMTTLLGPSGCGKTTLLKIIAGLLEPTAGEVWIDGVRVFGPGPERAFVFQDFALLPWATVLRNVAFGLELQGREKAEREEVARASVEKVGLTGFEHSYPHELSGGMRQRVGLARALCVDAKVLLMDEPFSAVDEQTRRLFQEELLRLLAKENKTVIFVTHSIEEAVYVSDRIVLLSPRPGRINRIVTMEIDREGLTSDEIRREKGFLDTVEDIWTTLKKYLDDERMEG
jgi:NitT/TauT family transport system ATP-binding protein